jgi:hypothetical protein
VSWLRRLLLALQAGPEVLPPPDRSVKRNAQIYAEMALLRARHQREG